MTLFSIEGKKQQAIGRNEYWRRFEYFQGTELHSLFVKEIKSIIEQCPKEGKIDSRQATKEILTKFEQIHFDILSEWDSETLAGLFGMTLWNVLATHPERWHFYRTIGKDGEMRGTLYWRG